MTGRPSSRRRQASGFGSGARRAGGTPNDDPLNPDVVPGSPEDEMGDPESVARGVCLRALTGAPKTRQQLADLLTKRGVPDDASASPRSTSATSARWPTPSPWRARSCSAS